MDKIQDQPTSDEYYSCLECGREMQWNEFAGRYECPDCKWRDE